MPEAIHKLSEILCMGGVAMLWFVTGIVFELIGVPFLYLKQNSPAFVFMMLATVVLVIVMVVVYLSISRKYEEK